MKEGVETLSFLHLFMFKPLPLFDKSSSSGYPLEVTSQSSQKGKEQPFREARLVLVGDKRASSAFRACTSENT